MPRTRARSGELKQYDEPEWAPLLRLVGRRVVADFMWMHEIELADGTAVHAYKHIDTRRYIHLDDSCQAYVYEESDRYRPTDPAGVLRAVFAGLSGLAGVERPQVEESSPCRSDVGGASTQCRGSLMAFAQPLTRQGAS